MKFDDKQEDELKFQCDAGFSPYAHIHESLVTAQTSVECGNAWRSCWYFDTDDFALYRIGCYVRLGYDRCNGKMTLNFKYPASVANGFFSRRELREKLSSPMEGLEDLYSTRCFQAAGDYLRQVSDKHKSAEGIRWCPILETSRHRTEISIVTDRPEGVGTSREYFCACLDHIKIVRVFHDSPRYPQDAEFHEVEVEIMETDDSDRSRGRLVDLSRLLQDRGYTPSIRNKYERVLAMGGLPCHAEDWQAEPAEEP